VPRISSFYGIVITMYLSEHPPPHFHARYAEHTAQVLFDGSILSGSLPTRARALVAEWARLHADELVANWERAKERQRLVKIDPLP
jgi:hypothetical protein